MCSYERRRAHLQRSVTAENGEEGEEKEYRGDAGSQEHRASLNDLG